MPGPEPQGSSQNIRGWRRWDGRDGGGGPGSADDTTCRPHRRTRERTMPAPDRAHMEFNLPLDTPSPSPSALRSVGPATPTAPTSVCRPAPPRPAPRLPPRPMRASPASLAADRPVGEGWGEGEGRPPGDPVPSRPQRPRHRPHRRPGGRFGPADDSSRRERVRRRRRRRRREGDGVSWRGRRGKRGEGEAAAAAAQRTLGSCYGLRAGCERGRAGAHGAGRSGGRW